MKYSETEKFRPRVWIDATVLSSLGYPRTGGWLGSNVTGSDPVALQGLKISWGAKDWWNNFDPARLELELVDPHGDLIELPPGTSISVATTGTGSSNTQLFWGRITETSAEYRPRLDSATGATVSSWLVRVIAECPLAELAADRLHEHKHPIPQEPNKYMHWCESYYSRLHALDQRLKYATITHTAPAVDGWLHTDPQIYAGVPGLNFDFFGYKNDENVSTLSVLRHTARAVYPTNRPYFVADRHTIRYDCGLPVAPAIDVMHPVMQGINLLDASRFIVERVKTATGMKNTVSRIGITTRFMDTDRTEHTAVSAANVDTQNTVEIFTGRHMGTAELYALPEARKALQAVYGLYEYPEITLLPHTAPTAKKAVEELEEFLRTSPQFKQSTPSSNPADFAYRVYYLAGSALNWLSNVEAVTFIGGAISFVNDEWRIDLKPAGVPFRKDGTTIPQLQQLSSRALTSAGDALNLADLEKTRF